MGKNIETTELTDQQLDTVTGGDMRQEAQLFQALVNAVSEVSKNLSGALQAAARSA
jgi:hypothetical protein